MLILPSAAAALILSPKFETLQVLHTFGVFLQSVAIVPQVYFVSKCKQVEAVVISYISCLGLHLGFYLTNWYYIYMKQGEIDRIIVSSGLVQLIFYCDFFARNLPILKSKLCSEPSSVDLPYCIRSNNNVGNAREINPASLNLVTNLAMPEKLSVIDGCEKNGLILGENAQNAAKKAQKSLDKNEDDKVADGNPPSR